MESFFQPVVGRYEELELYDSEMEFREGDASTGDYTLTNNIYPDVAFFWFGVCSHVAAITPFVFYVMFYR
jgi:hypothetical protein